MELTSMMLQVPQLLGQETQDPVETENMYPCEHSTKAVEVSNANTDERGLQLWLDVGQNESQPSQSTVVYGAAGDNVGSTEGS
jgi:hypothetical protein